jgi:hypothetical protein
VSGIYYVDMLEVLKAAGCAVSVGAQNEGWESRARSSGGWSAPPLGLWWHHTASSSTPANDLAYMCTGSDDAPIGNLYIDRDGVCWPIAAGASNCAGKGGPYTFSRGTVPLDGGNTRGWQIEVANNGVGERWPQEQVDAFFKASNALNAHVGNQPYDIVTHAAWTFYTRKIDPATADAVEGPWRPRSLNSSGTWSLDDIVTECVIRATPPDPEPEPPEEDPDMPLSFIAALDGQPTLLVAIDGAGTSLMAFLTAADEQAIGAAFPKVPTVRVSTAQYNELYRIAGAGEAS